LSSVLGGRQRGSVCALFLLPMVCIVSHTPHILLLHFPSRNPLNKFTTAVVRRTRTLPPAGIFTLFDSSNRDHCF
jgi:hypothetical protein